MEDTKNAIEFEIPDGYEFDLTKSGCKTIVFTKRQGQNDSRTEAARNVHESGETAIYEPKVGDLVYAETPSRLMRFIVLRQKSGDIVIDDIFDNWSLYMGEEALIYNYIRPATAEEAALFARILSENGYIYDAEKKEVRKEGWRAKRGEPYLYVSEVGTVYEGWEFGTWFDSLRHRSGNYFRPEEHEEAVAVAAEFREILNKRQ